MAGVGSSTVGMIIFSMFLMEPPNFAEEALTGGSGFLTVVGVPIFEGSVPDLLAVRLKISAKL